MSCVLNRTVDLTQAQAAQICELLVALKDISASQYTAGAALVLFLCDTIHHIRDDLTYVLLSRPRAIPTIYFINRIFALACLVVVNIALIGFIPPLSDQLCQILLGVDLTLGVISIGLTDAVFHMLISNLTLAALVTFEVWRLWDRNALAGRILVASFLATSMTGLACMLAVDAAHLKFAKYQPQLKACILDPTPKKLIAALYGSGLFFEFAVFLSTCINILHRPRKSQTKLTAVLYRDGCLYFVAVSALRLTNTVVAVISRESANYLVNHLVWSLVLLLLNQLVRNQCKGRRLASINESKIAQTLRYSDSQSGIAIDREVDVELDMLPHRKK